MIPSDDRTTAIPSGGVLAPIGRRALGAIIDQVLVLVPVAIGVLVSGYEPGTSLTDESLLWLNAISVGVGFAYEAVMIGILGRTVGKIAGQFQHLALPTLAQVRRTAQVQHGAALRPKRRRLRIPLPPHRRSWGWLRGRRRKPQRLHLRPQRSGL